MSPLSSPALPAQNRIVVVPLPPLTQPDALALITRIRTASPRKEDVQEGGPSQPPPAASDTSPGLRWSIRNRYYTAEVEFEVCTKPEELVAEDGAEPEDGKEEVPPAVVMLAEASASPSEETAAALSRLAARSPEWDVALLLSLPAPSSSSSSSPDESAWDDLALSHGFEWVDFTASAAFPSSPAEDADADPAPSQFPLSRVTEALQAHLWSNLRRLSPPSSSSSALPPRPRPRPEATLDGDEIADEDEEDVEGFLNALGAPPLPQPRAYVPPKVDFPETFLPSIPRGAAAASSSGPDPEAFEDDFSPLASGPSSSALPPPTTSTSSSSAAAAAAAGRLLASLSDDDDNFDEEAYGSGVGEREGGAFPPAAGGEGEDLPEVEALDALFARLSGFSSAAALSRGGASAVPDAEAGSAAERDGQAPVQAAGASAAEEGEETPEARDARRAAAERLVRDVFGAYGVGLSDSEGEEE
ncbi:hypothetical protein JCM6882_008458 [Rhodosporidiobolus microsporus]